MVQKDTIRDYLIEQNKQPAERRNLDLIQKLRYEIRENAKLQELSLGKPVIAQIKAKLEHAAS